jgi:hypothetical protein
MNYSREVICSRETASKFNSNQEEIFTFTIRFHHRDASNLKKDKFFMLISIFILLSISLIQLVSIFEDT